MLDNTFFVRTVKGSSVNDKNRGDGGREGGRGLVRIKINAIEGRREGRREGGKES